MGCQCSSFSESRILRDSEKPGRRSQAVIRRSAIAVVDLLKPVPFASVVVFSLEGEVLKKKRILSEMPFRANDDRIAFLPMVMSKLELIA